MTMERRRSPRTWAVLAICLTALLSACWAEAEGGAPGGAAVDSLTNNRTNGTEPSNATTTTTPVPTTTTTTVAPKKDLPDLKDPDMEHSYSMTIFFVLMVVALCILLVHMLIQTKFHYLPESIAIILLGTGLGLILSILSHYNLGNWQTEEHFPPTMFFLVLLPPIIFESGYNLHKGNFFQNIGTILLFAIVGTVISAVVVGGGVYLLGRAQVAYQLTLVESFAFGSLISAVDPVATLAIFQALDIDPVLYMLVFGESILNDAVSIVLTTTILELASPAMADMTGAGTFFMALGRFCLMFFASSAIGVVFGLLSAMTLKFVDLRKTPSLEFGLMMSFAYLPYGLAEGLHLSGIMAIMFCAIVMSHYTHLNLSPVTQITIQQTFRTIAFIAETCVFAYLGMAIFSFSHVVKPALVIWSIVLILIGRAMNICPLSYIANYFREHKITKRMQFVMWFSGLRGAIAFALSLHLDFEDEKRHVMVTTTLIIVLFTITILGGSTMPMMKLLKAEKRKKARPGREVSLSKTKEMEDSVDEYESAEEESQAEKFKLASLNGWMKFIHIFSFIRGEAVDSEHLSELTEEEYEVNYIKPHLKGFLKLDARYLVPFFTRRFTQQEVREGRTQMRNLTNQWYQEVRAAPSETEDEDEEEHEV